MSNIDKLREYFIALEDGDNFDNLQREEQIKLCSTIVLLMLKSCHCKNFDKDLLSKKSCRRNEMNKDVMLRFCALFTILIAKTSLQKEKKELANNIIRFYQENFEAIKVSTQFQALQSYALSQSPQTQEQDS